MTSGRSWLTHIEMMRPYTLVYPGLIALSGAVLATTKSALAVYFITVLSACIGWIAALYGCDYFDKNLDSIAKPSRPIPSGQVRPSTALTLMFLYAGLGMLLAAVLSMWNVALSVGIALMAALYAAFLKKRGVAGHLCRGSVTGLGFLYGVVAVMPSRVEVLWPIAVSVTLHDAGTNIVGAIRDMVGDLQGGYHTAPVKYGVRGSLLIASFFALGCFVICLQRLGVDASARGLLLVAGLLFSVSVGAGLVNASSISRRKALGLHKILVVERIALASGLMAFAVGGHIAVVVFFISSAITLFFQWMLRDAYEFGPTSMQARSVPVASLSQHGDALAFIEEQLMLARTARLSLPRSWNRRIKLVITDVDLTIHLKVCDGTVCQCAEAEYLAFNFPRIQLAMSSEIVFALFRDKTIPLIRAYASKKMQIDCGMSDLVRLREIANVLVAPSPNPASIRSISVTSATNKNSLTLSDQRQDEQDTLSRPIFFSDTTLRDGEQAPGVAFSLTEKIALAQTLDELGVAVLEIGYPAVSTREREAIDAIVALDLRAVTQVIARCTREDIELAVKSGASSIAVFIGTSDVHVLNKLQTTRPKLLSLIKSSVEYAKSSGAQVVFAPEDATRTEWPFLVEVCLAAAQSGADVIGLPDTVGIMTPTRMQLLVKSLVSEIPLPIAVHCHNDLGLATANSIAGLLGGAVGVQCSMLGLGERSGNAALEEVATVLEVAYKVQTGIDLGKLFQTAQQVKGYLGFRGHDLPKAIVGRSSFSHESGLHLDGVLRDPSCYEPFAPELVGRQREFIFGKHSGRNGVRTVLQEQGVVLSQIDEQRLLSTLEDKAYQGRLIGIRDLERLARRISAS